MSYRVLFPLDIDDNNRYTLYDIALLAESLGVVGCHWWHGPLFACHTLEEGLKRAREILRSFEEGTQCPCNQERCRIVEHPNYFVKSAPIPLSNMGIKKKKKKKKET